MNFLRVSKSAAFFTVVTLLISLCTGCSKTVDLHDIYDSNIKKLNVAYSIFLAQHNYEGPKDEQELKSFLTSDPTALHLLKRIDVTPENLDSMFVSERDHKPFVVRYGLNGQADHAVVFEATGIDGKRRVALSDPVELGQAEYEAYLSGEKKGQSMGDQPVDMGQ